VKTQREEEILVTPRITRARHRDRLQAFEFENDRRVSHWVDHDGRPFTLTARATF